jgi:hypothetical protein
MRQHELRFPCSDIEGICHVSLCDLCHCKLTKIKTKIQYVQYETGNPNKIQFTSSGVMGSKLMSEEWTPVVGCGAQLSSA